MDKRNIFVAVDGACAQRDGDGTYHLHIGQQGLTGVTPGELRCLFAALSGMFSAIEETDEPDTEDEGAFDAEG